MSKRLQVLLSDEEMEAIQAQAESESLTVGEYVRQALRDAGSQRPAASAASKLASIRKAVKHAFPTGDIEKMNEEIERGYRS